MRASEIIMEREMLDVPTNDIPAIAKKHNVHIRDIVDALVKGIEVEMEHTTDENIAKEIALDHLNELPDYYDRLEKIENESI